MKTIKLFYLCFLASLAMPLLSAQTSQENYSEVTVWEWSGYWQPVYCGGVLVDELTGTLMVHTVDHVKKGVWTSLVSHVYGEVTSTYTGEVFTDHEVDKCYPPLTLDTWHFNLIGNKGTHYIGSMKLDYGDYYDPTDDILTIDRLVCLDNKK